MNTEKVLEGLNQEERLELLERLIQRAFPVLEESTNIEERTERLVEALGSGHQHACRGRRFSGKHGMARKMGCQCGCH
ncbi:hypothetical protein BMS3Bbin13_00027 [bacterium BMS3Bbin13]|nr:hypothetical protein BMS3Bbin13_00027 [bacterium BMS3Bbin13]